MRAQTRAAWGTWGTLAVAAVAAVVLKWPSFAAYWVQTRHAPLPFEPPAGVVVLAAAFDEHSQHVRGAAKARLQPHDAKIVRAVNEAVYRTETKRLAAQAAALAADFDELQGRLRDLETERVAVAARLAALEVAPPEEAPEAAAPAPPQASPTTTAVVRAGPVATRTDRPDGEPALEPGERILFVGDSLMQGVAPHIRRSLCGGQGARCVDLSKPSSGLSQRWFHDWPRTIAQTFERERFTILIVFLGANDPWDMIEGASRVPFRSEAWRGVYAERVRDIVRTARAQGARVYWVGLPSMRVPRLQEGTFVQNEIFATVVQEEGGMFIPTRALLGDGTEAFSRFVRLAEGREVAVRGDDGVHFTLTGQKLIADAVLSGLRTSAVAAGR